MSTPKTSRRRPAGQPSAALPVFILSVAVASVFVGIVALVYRPAVAVFFGLMAVMVIAGIAVLIHEKLETRNLRKRGFNL